MSSAAQKPTTSLKRGRWGDHRTPDRDDNGAERRIMEEHRGRPQMPPPPLAVPSSHSSRSAPSGLPSRGKNDQPSQPAVSQDDALRALLQSVEAKEKTKQQQSLKANHRNPPQGRGVTPRDGPQRRETANRRRTEEDGGDAGYYGPSQHRSSSSVTVVEVEDGARHPSRRSASTSAAEDDGVDADGKTVAPPEKKLKPDFGLSGALAKDSRGGNVYKGVVLKFREPPEARAPTLHWRLYVHKGDELLETLHVSRQSAYLLGRMQDVADIPLLHPSCSSQHAVLQYRAVPSKQHGGRLHTQPYLMDLESTNGTFLNGVKLDPARYYQLRKGDVLTFGASTREYVLLHD